MACIKTGAMVHFMEYGVTHLCDVHQVGNCAVLKWKDPQFFNHDRMIKRPMTHQVVINEGVLDKEKGYAVTKIENFVAL